MYLPCSTHKVQHWGQQRSTVVSRCTLHNTATQRREEGELWTTSREQQSLVVMLHVEVKIHTHTHTKSPEVQIFLEQRVKAQQNKKHGYFMCGRANTKTSPESRAFLCFYNKTTHQHKIPARRKQKIRMLWKRCEECHVWTWRFWDADNQLAKWITFGSWLFSFSTIWHGESSWSSYDLSPFKWIHSAGCGPLDCFASG